MSQKKALPLIAILITSVIWGLSFLSIKVTVAVLPPNTLALLRFIIGSIVLFILYRRMEKERKSIKEDLPIFALSGLIGVSTYFYFENNAIKLISASSASIIIAAIPILTLIAESIVFKTKLTIKKIISVIISFTGVYFIVGFNSGASSMSSTKGYILMFGAAIAWVTYSIITKPLYKKYSQITIVFYQTLFGTLFLVPFAAFDVTKWSLVNNVIILNVIYLGVLSSAIAYYLYIYAMGHLGVSTTSMFLNLLPVVAVIASYFILKETISIHQIIGGTLVILSVYLVNSKEKNNEDKPTKKESIEIAS